MRTVRVLLLLLPLVVAAFAGCATNSTPTPPTTATPAGGPTTPVKVGTEASYPPFEDTMTSGDIVGFDIEVVKEIANRSALAVTFQNAQFQAIIPSVQSGQFDMGASAFTITDERKQQVDFSVAYYDNDLEVAVRAAESRITKEGDLKTHKVCTQTGTTSETWLLAHGQPNESIVRFDAFPPCADALKRGDVDAMMIDKATVRDLVGKSNAALKNGFTITTGEQFGFPVKKGNTALLTKLNTALVAMKQDGTLAKLAEKWQV